MSGHVRQRLAELRKRPPEARALQATEHQEQCCVVEWWALQHRLYGLPEFALYAVPNAGAGAQKGQAGKMKAEGARPGIPDLVLAAPRGGFHGLYVEMKANTRSARVSPEQREVLAYLVQAGYRAVACFGAEAARACITSYLKCL